MILLDTHTLLWWINDPQELPESVQKAIKQAKQKGELAISAMSVWEIAMLHKKRRLVLGTDFPSWMEKVTELPFLQIIPPDYAILIQSVFLPDPFHSDPADRIIVATAIHHRATLISKDQKILSYPHVKTFWA